VQLALTSWRRIAGTLYRPSLTSLTGCSAVSVGLVVGASVVEHLESSLEARHQAFRSELNVDALGFGAGAG